MAFHQDRYVRAYNIPYTLKSLLLGRWPILDDKLEEKILKS